MNWLTGSNRFDLKRMIPIASIAMFFIFLIASGIWPFVLEMCAFVLISAVVDMYNKQK